jgi:hypothetical protein
MRVRILNEVTLSGSGFPSGTKSVDKTPNGFVKKKKKKKIAKRVKPDLLH